MFFLNLVLKVLSKGTSTDCSTVSVTGFWVFFGCWIPLFLQGILFPFNNFSSCLFVACAYSPIQYVHSVSMAKSYIFGMDGESTGNNNTALISLIFQPLLYFFGNKTPGRQALQTSFYIFFRLSPDWPQASFIIIKKKNKSWCSAWDHNTVISLWTLPFTTAARLTSFLRTVWISHQLSCVIFGLF